MRPFLSFPLAFIILFLGLPVRAEASLFSLRKMPSSEMVTLISFFAVLLIFFSIDIKSRIRIDDERWHVQLFEWVSRIGGVSTAIALTLGWVDLFLPDEGSIIHVAFVAVPGSIGVFAAIVLGLEMLWQRDDDSAD